MCVCVCVGGVIGTEDLSVLALFMLLIMSDNALSLPEIVSKVHSA